MKEPLDKFGSFFVQNLRDKMLYDLDMILRGAWKAPESRKLQSNISSFSDAQKDIVRDIADHIITSGMHDLLFAIQEEADADGSVRVSVDGKEIAKFSDGLHGEIFGVDGWISRFSKFPAEKEIQRSLDAKEDI